MRRVLALTGVVVLLAGALPVAAAGAGALYRHLPKDPLLVLAVSTEEVSAKLDAAAEWLADDTDLDPAIGIALARELLAALGPEAALAIDLPPLDSIAAELRFSGGESYAKVLAGSGLLATVRDGARLDQALTAALGALAVSKRDEDGISAVRIPGDAFPAIDVYWAVRAGRFVAGFSREWVAAGLGDGAATERLPAGEDFGRVFAQLDERPKSLTYVNLPKLHRLLVGSQIVGALLEGDGELRRFAAPLLDAQVMALGLGSTSVAAGPGVRTTSFGPYWMSGTVASSSLLVALAVPTLLVATDRGKAQTSLDDIQSIAAACEEFSIDSRSYPGPTGGWVPVGEVAAFLEPIYIPALPRTDAWDNPILYWSDGATYRILSMGPDGRMDRDWSGVTEPTLSAKRVGDIVVANGRILALPQRFSD